MGYLDTTTITVDAILTKRGRQILSEGKQLNIDTFTLSDTGVDYTLWNPDHPSGSAYYGEAIEKMPNLEASVHAYLGLKNKLVSLNRDTISMPVVELSPDPRCSYVFSTRTPKDFIATIVGISGGSRFQLLIQDKTVVSSTGKKVELSGNALSFITEQDYHQSVLYETVGSGNSATFKISPLTIRDPKNASTNLTFIHESGAYVTIEVEVKFNEDIRQTIASSKIIGT
jgi:hypothetical protein